MTANYGPVTPHEKRLIRFAVEKGVILLENHDERWFTGDKIKLSTLDLGDGSICILGQLYGTYSKGLERLNLNHQSGQEHGFDVDDDYARPETYAYIEKQWAKVIKQKRKELARELLPQPQAQPPRTIDGVHLEGWLVEFDNGHIEFYVNRSDAVETVANEPEAVATRMVTLIEKVSA